MILVIIILATLLAISAGLHVYQAKLLRQWDGFDEASTQILGDALTNRELSRQETIRWRQRCFATLDRNLWLRTRLEELQIQYDDLFVRYCKQSLSATEVGEDAAEILNDFIAKSGPLSDEENAEMDALMAEDQQLMHHVPPIHDHEHTPGCTPFACSTVFVVDDSSDIEVPIDYYLVDRGE